MNAVMSKNLCVFGGFNAGTSLDALLPNSRPGGEWTSTEEAATALPKWVDCQAGARIRATSATEDFPPVYGKKMQRHEVSSSQKANAEEKMLTRALVDRPGSLFLHRQGGDNRKKAEDRRRATTVDDAAWRVRDGFKIGKQVPMLVLISMREKHTAEALLTVNGVHYSGLHDVLSQITAFGKYDIPAFDADAIDGSLCNKVVDLAMESQDIKNLAKAGKTPVKPLLYFTTDAERRPFAVKFGKNNTVLHSSTGEPLAAGEYICVLGPDKKLYAAKEPPKTALKEFRHSTFFAGGMVYCAGEFKVNARGVMLSWNNKSGHYRPDFRSWGVSLRFLAACGLNVSRIKKTFVTKTRDRTLMLDYVQRDGLDTGALELRVKRRT